LARKVLQESSAIQMVDAVLPTELGQEIRKRWVYVPARPLLTCFTN
jgi:hypothetical protein